MENKYCKVVLTVMAVVALCWPRAALAQYYSQGSGKAVVTIDKKVRGLNSTNFQDNIDKSEKVFIEGDVVEFSMTVENTGNEDLFNLKLTDWLPADLKVVFNPGEVKNSLVTWQIDKLAVGESKTFMIRTQVKALTYKVPTMLANRACVETNTSASDCDKAAFFVSGKAVPSTGPADFGLETILGLSGIATAWGLRKKARGY